jgi:hypothetical protein
MKNLAIAFFACLLLSSCKTYTVAPDSFKKQFTEVNRASLQQTEINNPLNPFMNIQYPANQLKKIVVLDKNGQQVSLYNSPALETRVTLKNGKRYHFYFDTLILENDSLSGGRSRFVQSLSRKLPFDSIQKIEIQDGGKKYSYQ